MCLLIIHLLFQHVLLLHHLQRSDGRSLLWLCKTDLARSGRLPRIALQRNAAAPHRLIQSTQNFRRSYRGRDQVQVRDTHLRRYLLSTTRVQTLHTARRLEGSTLFDVTKKARKVLVSHPNRTVRELCLMISVREQI